ARLPALRSPGRSGSDADRRPAGEAAGAGRGERDPRDAPAQLAGPQAVLQAQGVRRPRAPARRAEAPALRDHPGGPVGPGPLSTWTTEPPHRTRGHHQWPRPPSRPTPWATRRPPATPPRRRRPPGVV